MTYMPETTGARPYNCPMFDARQLGNTLLIERRRLGLDQEELSRRSGVSRSRISEIERGKAANVGLDAIFNLAEALGVTVPYLLGLSQDALGEGDAAVLRAMSGEYLTVEVDSREQRRLLQEAIEALSALPPREQSRAVQLLRMLRQIEEDDSGLAPRIVE